MKDAHGHGSNPRGGSAAHQSGVNKITAFQRKWLTPLGIKTLQNQQAAASNLRGPMYNKSAYTGAARDARGGVDRGISFY
jgi:hypothetical protein